MRRVSYYILIFFVIILGSWAGGFISFVYHIPQSVTDSDTHTDAIVVLTGSPCRITAGVHLLAKGYADQLFISGVPEKQSKKSLLLGGSCPSHLLDAELEILTPKTIVGNSAKTTQENALETQAWIEENHIKTIRLVTSAMHLPRSLIEFQRHIPGIQIVPHPVITKTSSYKKWYRSWPVFSKLFLEYNKFLLAHVPWLHNSLASFTRSKK
jgi:uncharacterized SAM-binding protein YcdF (DUF218 family)